MSDDLEPAVSELELVELFRPRRPDAASFRAGVARRIEERARAEAELGGSRPESADRSGPMRSEFLRRAAALIPLDPLSGSSGLGGTAKLVTTTIALPFVVLVASVGAFVAALRSIRRSADRAVPAATEPSTWPDFAGARNPSLGLAPWIMTSIQIAGSIVLVAPIVTGSRFASDALLVVFLLATVALVVLVRGLAESALLTSRVVSRFARSILGALFCGTFLWSVGLPLSDGGSDLGIGVAGGIVLTGLVLCSLQSALEKGWGAMGWIAWVIVVVVLLNPLGVTRTSTNSLERQLGSIHLEAGAVTSWDDAGRLHEALVAVGASPPPSAAVEAELDRELDAAGDTSPHMWTAALHMGLLTKERWTRLAARGLHPYQLDQLTTLSGPLYMQPYHEYQIPMLLATRALTQDQRQRLADRVEASWPTLERFDPLSGALLCVRLFDHLGFTDRANAHRADVHAMLLHTHIASRGASRFGRVGGFTSDPARFATSFAGATHDAVLLMARFGVPDGIDARAVRGFLRRESRATPLFFEWSPELKATSRAALLRLGHEIGYPRRTPVEALVGERLVIAALLVVILCLLAIRWAPSVQPRAASGALP